jgi:hypothetical protein
MIEVLRPKEEILGRECSYDNTVVLMQDDYENRFLSVFVF